MNPEKPKNPHLKIVPKEPLTPEEIDRRLREEGEAEPGTSARITPYNIDDFIFDKTDPQKNNDIKIENMEFLLEHEKFDGPEEHDIAKKLIELKDRKF